MASKDKEPISEAALDSAKLRGTNQPSSSLLGGLTQIPEELVQQEDLPQEPILPQDPTLPPPPPLQQQQEPQQQQQQVPTGVGNIGTDPQLLLRQLHQQQQLQQQAQQLQQFVSGGIGLAQTAQHFQQQLLLQHSA